MTLLEELQRNVETSRAKFERDVQDTITNLTEYIKAESKYHCSKIIDWHVPSTFHGDLHEKAWSMIIDHFTAPEQNLRIEGDRRRGTISFFWGKK